MKGIILSVIVWVSLVVSARAENWHNWRGPYYNGSTSESNLPAQWDWTSSNVLWKVEMSGVSAATPVVWGDTVFVTTPDQQGDLFLCAINVSDGKIKWQRKVSTGNRVVNLNNMASPSPVTDGKIVIVMFGTGALAAFDFQGNEIWKKDLAAEFGKFAIMYLYGASPLLYNNKLYVPVIQRDDPKAYPHSRDDKPVRESFILCLDPATGKTLWRHIRKTDAAMESMESYTTPIPHKGKNGLEILILGGDYVTAHNPETGEEVWRAGGLNPRQTDMQKNWFRVVPSPLSAGDVIVACAPKGQPVIGIKDGGKGLITETHSAWVCKETTTDWSTPLYYKGKIYVLDGGKRTLTCLEPSTGKVVWSGQLGVSERIWSSPTGADDKIYCVSEKGTVIVCGAGSEFKILATNQLDESPTRASVSISNGKVFVRTSKHLYCIGFK
ncbi:MAG: PQQ-binding-like beta-propeller repeat protein [Verrucomicrobiae bacterium]|nr:PQQ-binding-like beta-propeller repeat protein [Verrucomicrobiae bacterium]